MISLKKQEVWKLLKMNCADKVGFLLFPRKNCRVFFALGIRVETVDGEQFLIFFSVLHVTALDHVSIHYTLCKNGMTPESTCP